MPKIPSLDQISNGYQSFIGEQSGKIGNFLNGLFGKNGEKNLVGNNFCPFCPLTHVTHFELFTDEKF